MSLLLDFAKAPLCRPLIGLFASDFALANAILRRVSTEFASFALARTGGPRVTSSRRVDGFFLAGLMIK
jgi:hypothetical protein